MREADFMAKVEAWLDTPLISRDPIGTGEGAFDDFPLDDDKLRTALEVILRRHGLEPNEAVVADLLALIKTECEAVADTTADAYEASTRNEWD